jgi:rod shape-determining protein MreC
MLVLNHQHAHLKTIRTGLSALVAPTEYVINLPAKMITWLGESITSRQKLISENEKLESKVLLLNAQLQKQLLLQQENTQLRAFLDSTPQTQDKVLVAQLLAVDPDPFAAQVIIDKGAKQEVYSGQPVLDGSGVFGQVIQIGAFTSQVMLITDSRSAVPVEDSRSGVRGIVIGKGNPDQLELVDMPITADIRVGDQLNTSGLGEKFPVGYPVGVITSISQNPGRSFATVAVQPSAHLDRGHLVLLVWPNFETTLQKQAIALKQSKVNSQSKPIQLKGKSDAG